MVQKVNFRSKSHYLEEMGSQPNMNRTNRTRTLIFLKEQN